MEFVLEALKVLFQPVCLLLVAGGAILGMVMGAIPGLSGGLAITLLLPMCYSLNRYYAIAMLIGIWVGSMSGSCIGSILLGIPGTASSIATVYDGYELQGHDISDIAIFGTGSYEDVLITVDPRYAAILAFYDCSGVTLEHFTAGHTLGSECGGSVLYFERCSSVLIEDTDLYGCGIYGVEAYFCNNLAVQDSILRDCSYGPAAICYGSGLLSFDGCEFYGNTGSFAIFDNDKPVYFSSCTFGSIESGIQFNDGVVLDPSNELEEYTGEYPDIEEDWDGEYPDTESDFEEEGDQG